MQAPLMSTSSKSRRDQRRRQEQQAANKAAATASPVEPHAELRDTQRTLLAGVVRRDGEWVLAWMAALPARAKVRRRCWR